MRGGERERERACCQTSFDPSSIFQASDRHLMVVQRVSVLCVGMVSTAISLSVPVIYGIFILAADIVYVIVLPQLTYAIFLGHRGDAVGAVSGFLVGVVMRFGAGEPTVGLQPFLLYSDWDPQFGQSFPFRTTAMVCSGLTIVLVSEIVRILRQRNCGKEEENSPAVEVLSVSAKEEGDGDRRVLSEQEMSLLCSGKGDATERN